MKLKKSMYPHLIIKIGVKYNIFFKKKCEGLLMTKIYYLLNNNIYIIIIVYTNIANTDVLLYFCFYFLPNFVGGKA